MLIAKKVFFYIIFIVSFSANAQKLNIPADLKAHNDEFKRQVIKVTDGVYCAIGFGLANSIMIEGEEGVIIVDVMESPGAAKEVNAEFRKITQKPVKAIVYTHNHTDHIKGAAVFANGGNPMVIAQETLEDIYTSTVTFIKPIIEKRSLRMFGVYLRPEDELVNAGLGLNMNIKDTNEEGYLSPNTTFKDSLKMTISGIDFVFFHAPGETDDQLNVYIPSKKLVCMGDNLYRTFPNLYTIRGTPYRDPVAWYKSIDKVRYLKPEFIVPSHSKPFSGVENVQNILTTYRDGIQYTFDETIRQINKGKTPIEIAATIELPKHLKESPYLQEFYGKASWASRSIFSGILGFFDGNSTTLQPLAPDNEAEKMAELAGGMKKLKNKCLIALKAKEYQWVLDLSGHILRLDPEGQSIKNARMEALTRMGEAESNPNARHYYLTEAKELGGLDVKRSFVISSESIKGIPVMTYFNIMGVSLNESKSMGVNKIMQFNLTDEAKTVSVHIRNGVAEIQQFAIDNPDVIVTTTGQAWKEIVSKIKDPVAAAKAGEIKISNPEEFMAIMGMFGEL
jgi:alkyl sulfatase BDS1-like metallo-beta-lactamase superfamily hydrolase